MAAPLIAARTNSRFTWRRNRRRAAGTGGRGSDGLHQRFPTLLQRVRIDIRRIVFDRRFLVEEIASFPAVLCLSRRVFRLRPAAQGHVQLRSVERVVPGIARRWSELPLPVDIRCAARLAQGWIAGPLLARRDLIAVKGVLAV